jgi:hypothetical protein
MADRSAALTAGSWADNSADPRADVKAVRWAVSLDVLRVGQWVGCLVAQWVVPKDSCWAASWVVKSAALKDEPKADCWAGSWVGPMVDHSAAPLADPRAARMDD